MYSLIVTGKKYLYRNLANVMEFLNVKLFFHNLVRLTKKHVFLGTGFMKFPHTIFLSMLSRSHLLVSHVAVRGTRGTSRAGSGGVRRGSWMAHGSSALGPHIEFVDCAYVCATLRFTFSEFCFTYYNDFVFSYRTLILLAKGLLIYNVKRTWH